MISWDISLLGGTRLVEVSIVAARTVRQTCGSRIRRSEFLSLCMQLGLLLSPGKGFPPAQQGEFTGLCLDTVTGLVTVPERKLARIVVCLRASELCSK